MKSFLKWIGWSKEEKLENEMTLDEYIISIRPKCQELSYISTPVTAADYPKDKTENRGDDDDNGPEEAGCLVLA